MIDIKHFSCNMLQENCYVISDETKECIIIDCGAYSSDERKAIVEYIRTNSLKPVRLISTHGHLDHNFGNNTISEEFGITPEVSVADAHLLDKAAKEAEAFYGVKLDYELPKAKATLQANDIIRYGNQKLMVLETPGHTLGSVTFYDKENDLIFSGDTLFKNTIGRSDLESGNMLQIIQSLRMLAQLPDKTKVLPGHGPLTTIGEELAHNPYMER